MNIPLWVVVEGAIFGLNYGLLAIGLVLVYRTNRVLNFAQGQLGVVAAVFMVKLFYDFGINYWAALAMALVLAAGAGAGSELLLRRLFNRARIMVMVATIGLSQVLYLLILLPFIRPNKQFEPFPVPFDLSFRIDGIKFTPGEVLTLIAAPIVAIAVAAFIRWSPWGLAMRAMAENADSARLSGIWVRRTSTVAWTIAGVLSGVAAMLGTEGGSTLQLTTTVLSPDLLLLALTGALVGAMSNLPVTFIAAVAVGIIQEVLYNWTLSSNNGTATVQLVMFVILLVVLLIRVGALRIGARSSEASTWRLGTSAFRPVYPDKQRALVGRTGIGVLVVVAALLPLIATTGQSYIVSQICAYGVMALSLTVLTGWAGQVSLGQFGLVAVGADFTQHFSNMPLILILPLAGVVTAVVAVLVGLPALRVRGLYLAVSTLGFAVFMQNAVLNTPCETLPFIHKTICTGLPLNSLPIARPSFFGIALTSERAFAWFSLIVLTLTVLMVRVWRDKGIARRLISVRDNEIGAGSAGTPVVATKLLAFAISGFMAGYAGVMLAFATERISSDTFDPIFSILVISIVVIGGIDSIAGAIMGSIYLIGLPAIFGASPTITFLTSGLGLLAFVLYLPGGMAELLQRFGDLVSLGVTRVMDKGGGAGAEPLGGNGSMAHSEPTANGKTPSADKQPVAQALPSTST
jgi:ABC-type branched-subunit amino acid transport system permease subunit